MNFGNPNLLAPLYQPQSQMATTAPSQGSSGPVLLSSIASSIQEGWLTKQGSEHKTWKTRWFVLTHDILYYFKSNKPKEVLVGSIHLRGVTLMEDRSLNKKFCIKLAAKKSFTKSTEWVNRSYFLVAKTQVEMDEWMKALSKASQVISTIIERTIDHRSPTIVSRVIDQQCCWVETSGRKTRFLSSMTMPRHHHHYHHHHKHHRWSSLVSVICSRLLNSTLHIMHHDHNRRDNHDHHRDIANSMFSIRVMTLMVTVLFSEIFGCISDLFANSTVITHYDSCFSATGFTITITCCSYIVINIIIHIIVIATQVGYTNASSSYQRWCS